MRAKIKEVQNLQTELDLLSLTSIDLPDSNTLDLLGYTQGYLATNNHRVFTSLTGIQSQGMAQITIIGTGAKDFSNIPNVTHLDTLLENDGIMVVKIINVSKTATPNYFILDAIGSGVAPPVPIDYSLNYDFLNSQPWSVDTLPDGWTQPIGTQDGINVLIDEVAEGMRFKTSDAVDLQISHAGDIPILTSTVYNYEIVIDSVAIGGIYIYTQGTPSGFYTTPGTFTGTVDTGTWAFVRLRRASFAECDVVVRSLKLWL